LEDSIIDVSAVEPEKKWENAPPAREKSAGRALPLPQIKALGIE
jgi:hypothetical protein